MAADKLGLYQLLAPQFLLGFNFPDYIDKYLSVLSIEELRSTYDQSGIIYQGKASFVGDGSAFPVRRHEDPSGAIFEWDDVNIEFRLTLPRDGSDLLNEGVDDLAADPTTAAFIADIDTLFDEFGAINQNLLTNTPTEFPGFRFRLELLVSVLTFHLGENWKPGKLEGVRIKPDPSSEFKDVSLVLPKMVLEYEQGDDPSEQINFQLKSWGNAGFDAPSDLQQGELVRMQPEIAIHRDGKCGFGVGQVLLDLSQENTPIEILELFGTDEGFEGVFIKSARFFYSDSDKDWAINIGVQDLLVSFDGEISVEATAEYVGPTTKLKVEVKFFDGKTEIDTSTSVLKFFGTDSSEIKFINATVPRNAIAQVIITGGAPPFNVSAKFDTINAFDEDMEIWNEADRLARFATAFPNPLTDEELGVLTIEVADSKSPTPQTETQTISMVVTPIGSNGEGDGTDKDRSPELGSRQLAVRGALEVLPLTQGYEIIHQPSSSGESETLNFLGGETVKVNITNDDGDSVFDNTLTTNRQVTFDIAHDSTFTINAVYDPVVQVRETFDLFFDNRRPKDDLEASKYTKDQPDPPDSRFSFDSGGLEGLKKFINKIVPVAPSTTKDVEVRSHVSFEPSTTANNNSKLSQRRLDVAKEIIVKHTTAKITNNGGQGESLQITESKDAEKSESVQRTFRVARIGGVTNAGTPEVVINTIINRPARPDVPDEKVAIPPVPAPPANKPPPFIQSLGMRVKFHRNVFALFELFGTLNFETELEERLRNQAIADGEPITPDDTICVGGNDGIVEFKVNITHDQATHFWTETLMLGAEPNAKEGIYNCTFPRTDTPPKLKDMFGALLVFAPLINEVVSSFDKEVAGDWVALSVSLGVPVAMGALNATDVTKISLYGGELQFRQFIPPGENPLEFTSAGVIFDYAVEFFLEIPFTDISTEKPVKVRYKAVGFKLHTTDGVTYQPIFDTSKGYEIDIADPGLFSLPEPLGNILKVLGARFLRINPLVMELDLGLKADLGFISVDKFKVKWPIHPLGTPSIIPSVVSVDLSGVLIGTGFVNIEDKIENGVPIGKKIQGALDITLVSLKLRVAGAVSLEPIEDAASGRKATAFFASITIEFPSPIVIGATGLGLYGISGLFAMHYKRLEAPRQPNDTVGPALRWLQKAEGDPSKLINASGQELWGAEFDRWSFGVGVILGTLEGGFLINFRGMFVLELPGPRILIFVKIDVIEKLPEATEDTDKLLLGVLGVIDVDFNLRQLTVGVIINYEIKDLVKIQLPVEIFFHMDEPKNWHLHLGTNKQMAGAKVLNIDRAYGYFMIEGLKILDFPPGSNLNLCGTAVATGIEASVIWGDESIGLYLKVVAGAHIGISFTPDLFLVGEIFLVGELRLFIVSISAKGSFLLKAPDPTFIKGEICGKVSFFLFSVEGCVSIEMNNDKPPLPPPALVKNVYLQSYAPVITTGQGGDRPIDASLGNTALVPVGAGVKIPTVPIDSNIVIQFTAPPLVKDPVLGDLTVTFTNDLEKAPNLPNLQGLIDIGGGRRVQYVLKEIRLNETFSDDEKPPVVWRKDDLIALQGGTGPPGASVNTNIDLVLFSRTPTTAARALERSSDLENLITVRWGNLCDPIAPPACVFHTLCGQPIGPSGHGWRLFGTAWPDPPGTIRNSPPNTQLFIEEPLLTTADSLRDEILGDVLGLIELPAKVLGGLIAHPLSDVFEREKNCDRALELPTRTVNTVLDRGLALTEQIKELERKRADQHWLRFHTKPAKDVTFYLALTAELLAGKENNLLLVRELDKDRVELSAKPLQDFDLQLITNLAQLPLNWVDGTGPWFFKTFITNHFITQPLFKDLIRLVVKFEPSEKTEIIELKIVGDPNQKTDPSDFRRTKLNSSLRAIVVALEVCSLEEFERVENAEEIRDAELKTLTGYLNKKEKTALLSPDESYTLGITYEAITYEAETNDGVSDEFTNEFRFNTDVEPPQRLDAYVLGITPTHEEGYHFFEDPVKIVFNDDTILQLVKKYDRDLRLVVRGADGVPVALEDDGVETLDPILAEINSPYKDLIIALIQAGFLPCYGGSFTFEDHASFSVPVTLHPLMEYTLELVYEPPGIVFPSDSEDVVIPLFRKNFITSRFASAGELAENVQEQLILHRALNEPIALPNPATGEKLVQVPDIVIENALKAAGEQALPAPLQSGLRLYWTQKPGEDHYSLHAVLIDAAEPLWRERSEPKLKTMDDQDDDKFQVVVPQSATAMEVIDTTGGIISKFVKSPGGTRTLAYIDDSFAPPPEGASLELSLHRPASALYSLPDETIQLIEIIITAKAPWDGIG